MRVGTESVARGFLVSGDGGGWLRRPGADAGEGRV
jgi:hypothetical protein